jgi:hypothetical protein
MIGYSLYGIICTGIKFLDGLSEEVLKMYMVACYYF